jgi:NAD(P)-dependent dehydrogenase (short-subunit alcohol dehydrogenase family)
MAHPALAAGGDRVTASPSPVIVTGASSGIGRATAERLARRGEVVYATARHLEDLEELRRRGCRTLRLDVTDEESRAAAVAAVIEAEGTVGSLVNNAGYSQSGAVETLDPEALRRQFETNVFGVVRMCQLVLPAMRERHAGRIVNVSSMGANFVFPGGGAYHASKFALEALSDALRFEVAGFGIDVVIIQPGAIRTNFCHAAAASLHGRHDGGPYDDFNAHVGEITEGIYDSPPVRLLGGGPERVAATIERALTERRPRLRYRVTPSAHLMIAQRRMMTARMWDRFVGTQFPHPG